MTRSCRTKKNVEKKEGRGEFMAHDSLQHVNKVTDVCPGRELVHEAVVESALRPPHQLNMISFWSVPGCEGRPTPVARLLGGGKSSIPLRVEVWDVSSRKQRLEATRRDPVYSKPLSTALTEVVATRRGRVYVRFVAQDLSSPAKVHLLVDIAVDRRRSARSYSHIRSQEEPSVRGETMERGTQRVVAKI